MFSEADFQLFKKEAIKKRANRTYVSWRSTCTGLDCRNIGPSSPCFCGHRFKQHDTDSSDMRIFCRQRCACTQFDYVPVRGTQDLKCTVCKHSYTAHKPNGARNCGEPRCVCPSFKSSISCSCGESVSNHRTVFEKRQERLSAGRPVDNELQRSLGYEAMGGLTDMSSLIDGVERIAKPSLSAATYPRRALKTGEMGAPDSLSAVPRTSRISRVHTSPFLYRSEQFERPSSGVYGQTQDLCSQSRVSSIKSRSNASQLVLCVCELCACCLFCEFRALF